MFHENSKCGFLPTVSRFLIVGTYLLCSKLERATSFDSRRDDVIHVT